MTYSSITLMPDVRPQVRCPACGADVKRSCREDPEGDGALWELRESCIMCDWVNLIENVRLGV